LVDRLGTPVAFLGRFGDDAIGAAFAALFAERSFGGFSGRLAGLPVPCWTPQEPEVEAFLRQQP